MTDQLQPVAFTDLLTIAQPSPYSRRSKPTTTQEIEATLRGCTSSTIYRPGYRCRLLKFYLTNDLASLRSLRASFKPLRRRLGGCQTSIIRRYFLGVGRT